MQARFLTDTEWATATTVFGDTLPLRWRIIVTDFSAPDGSGITLPLSALNPITGAAALGNALEGIMSGLPPRWMGVTQVIDFFTNMAGSSVTDRVSPAGHASYVFGLFAGAFTINVGSNRFNNISSRLLVHELTHVWQGHNEFSANTYVHNSARHQARSAVIGSSRGGAYQYQPGLPFGAYNAEQQASIVEDWFVGGQRQSGDLWPYIRNYIRRGRTTIPG